MAWLARAGVLLEQGEEVMSAMLLPAADDARSAC
jgi:hypothetical protein